MIGEALQSVPHAEYEQHFSTCTVSSELFFDPCEIKSRSWSLVIKKNSVKGLVIKKT